MTSECFRPRWQAEICFHWVKPNLSIRSPYSTTPSAVRVEWRTAICTHLAVGLARHQLGLTPALTAVLQLLPVNAFQKAPIIGLLAEFDADQDPATSPNQLKMNGF